NLGLGQLPFDKLVSSVTNTAQGAINRTVDVQLNWSEYVQGEWTTRESSRFEPVAGGFTGSLADLQISTHVAKEVDPDTGNDGAVWITLYGIGATIREGFAAYRVVSKNSRPRIKRASNQLTARGPLPFAPRLATYRNPYS